MNKSEKCSSTQTGRVVIHKGDHEKRIYQDEVENYILNGWQLGVSDKHRREISRSNTGKEGWNKGLTKEINESLQSAADKLSKINKGKSPWNKGLTIQDERVKNNVDKSTATKIERYGSSFPNNNMNEEHKKKISQALIGNRNSVGPKSDMCRKHISEAKMGHEVSEETRQKISKSKKGKKLDTEALRIKLTKEYITKKKNNSFSKSSSEEQLYKMLLEENKNKTIYRQYKDDRYPFYCDFYILEDDLFIELNAHWTHGGKPYNPDDEECQKQLREWQEKAKTSQFYRNAIDTWTVRDVKKRQCAKERNLNYKVIY